MVVAWGGETVGGGLPCLCGPSVWLRLFRVRTTVPARRVCVHLPVRALTVVCVVGSGRCP